MPPAIARPLLEKGVGDYEHVLALQSAYFGTLGDHPKGELLFGLAEGYSRLGNSDKARLYFESPDRGRAGVRTGAAGAGWLATGAMPASPGLGCVGCHK